MPLSPVKPMLHERIADSVGQVLPHPAAPPPPRFEDPRVDLKELARILKRRRATVLWTAAVPLLLALAYSFLATPLYTTSTQILIDPRDRRIVSNEIQPEGLAADGGVSVVESQLLVISSDSVLRRAITREHLDADPEFGGEPTGVLAALTRYGLRAVGLESDAGDRNDPQLKALRQIKRRIGVKRSEKAFVAEIYVTTESKDKSVRVADAIAQAYLEDQAQARAAAAQRASGELGARLEALRNRVHDAEERVVHYKEQNSIIAAGGILVNEQQLSEMNIQLNHARARTAETRSRVEQIERGRRAGTEFGATSEAVQSQTIGQLRLQYAAVIRQRADLTARLGPRHPDVATLNAQVHDVQKLVDGELARIAAAAQSDLERAQASEQALERNLERLKKDAVATSLASVRLRELEREVEASRAVYETFLVRARETGEQGSIDSTNLRVISRATPPRDKSWPPRTLLLAIALVGGLGMGAGLGLMREYLNDSVSTRRQLQDITGLPVLAVLTDPSPRAKRRRLLGLLPGKRNAQGNWFADSIHGLADQLMDGGRAQRGRTLLISSTTSAEGKTLTALNLALEGAAAGKRILLVDADLDRRTLSQLRGASAGAGLFDLIEGRAMLSSMVLTETQTGLNFLPAGNASRRETRRPKPGEIVHKLIEPARNFDFVIIDCGSVLTDAYVQPFADVVDDVLFVVRAGTTRSDDILRAFEALRMNSRKVRGTVLTGATEDA